MQLTQPEDDLEISQGRPTHAATNEKQQKAAFQFALADSARAAESLVRSSETLAADGQRHRPWLGSVALVVREAQRQPVVAYRIGISPSDVAHLSKRAWLMVPGWGADSRVVEWTTGGPDGRILAMWKRAGCPALRTDLQATSSTGPRGKRSRRHRDW